MINRLLKPIKRRIQLLVNLAYVVLIDDNKATQRLQVKALAGEVMDNVERIQNYGFTSHPRPNAKAILLSVGGQRSHTLVIGVDDVRYRLKPLAQGEVAIYTDEGDFIHIKRGGTIAVKAATKLEVDAPAMSLTGDLSVDGDISGSNLNANGDVTATGEVADATSNMTTIRTIYNGHNHSSNGAAPPGAQM